MFLYRVCADAGRHLGVSLASSWLILVSSWRHLGSSWLILAHLGDPWRHLGDPLGPLGGSLEPSWDPLGLSWGPLGAILGPPGVPWGDLGDPLGKQLSDVQKHIVLLKSTRSGIDIYEVCLSQTLIFFRCDPQKFEHVRHFGRHFCVSLERQRFFFRRKRSSERSVLLNSIVRMLSGCCPDGFRTRPDRTSRPRL